MYYKTKVENGVKYFQVKPNGNWYPYFSFYFLLPKK